MQENFPVFNYEFYRVLNAWDTFNTYYQPQMALCSEEPAVEMIKSAAITSPGRRQVWKGV
jgi:ADP-glucose pyrophosphorylase